jgi:hypothetical protein
MLDHLKRLVNEGFFLCASAGLIPQISVTHKYGFNPDVGSGAFETIWDEGGDYPWMSSAAQFDLVSTSSDDVFDTGSGAQVVRIYGLDENWDSIIEDVELNGLTPVTTINSFLRVNEMTLPAESEGKTFTAKDGVGNITLKDGANVQAKIINGNNRSLMSVYSLPRNVTGFLCYGAATVGKGKEVRIQFKTREFSGVFQVAFDCFIYENTLDRPFVLPRRIEPKTDFDVRAIADIANVEVSCNYDLILIEDIVIPSV